MNVVEAGQVWRCKREPLDSSPWLSVLLTLERKDSFYDDEVGWLVLNLNTGQTQVSVVLLEPHSSSLYWERVT